MVGCRESPLYPSKFADLLPESVDPLCPSVASNSPRESVVSYIDLDEAFRSALRSKVTRSVVEDTLP